MSSTRNKGKASQTNFTDNPERIGKEKSRKKNKNMADKETAEKAPQPDTGDKNQAPDPEDNKDET